MNSQPLSERTLEELWQLFPIILRPHNPAYSQWYAEEAADLTATLGNTARRINHVGSTAVPGLLAKPTVDMLLEVSGSAPGGRLARSLRERGWLLMSGNSADHPVRLVFNKGYTPNGFSHKVFHLHVRPPGDWAELYFRDYLKDHPEVADAYAELKRSLLPRFEHDRDGYTEAKTDFILKTTALARAEHPGRYLPES